MAFPIPASVVPARSLAATAPHILALSTVSKCYNLDVPQLLHDLKLADQGTANPPFGVGPRFTLLALDAYLKLRRHAAMALLLGVQVPEVAVHAALSTWTGFERTLLDYWGAKSGPLAQSSENLRGCDILPPAAWGGPRSTWLHHRAPHTAAPRTPPRWHLRESLGHGWLRRRCAVLSCALASVLILMSTCWPCSIHCRSASPRGVACWRLFRPHPAAPSPAPLAGSRQAVRRLRV